MSVTKNGTIVFDNTVAEPKKFTAIVNSEIPETGTAGQFLKKTSTGVEFADIVQVPALPTADGNYKLNIASGVATWVAIV